MTTRSLNQSVRHIGKIIGYACLLAIGFLCIGLAVSSEREAYIKVIITSPGVAALSSALFLFLRDIMAHERQMFIRRREEMFEIGLASPMAEVAFNKHVEFCENYASKAGDILRALWGEGPSKNCLDYAQELSGIRSKHELWITPDIANPLKKFESVLGKMGTDSYITQDMQVGDERSKIIKKMYADWQDLIGVQKYGPDNKKDNLSVLEVFAWLQEVLGIIELTDLRKRILKGALK